MLTFYTFFYFYRFLWPNPSCVRALFQNPGWTPNPGWNFPQSWVEISVSPPRHHISILCSFKVLLHLYIDNNSKQYIYHENIILKKNIRQLRSLAYTVICNFRNHNSYSKNLNSYTDKVALLEASSNEDTSIRSLNLRDFKPNLCPYRRPREIEIYHGPSCPPKDI